ncbi:MAG: hypothetical protein QOH53_352 [Ilumatobacteraceae bacterium]
MIIKFVAGIATITADPETSRRLYIDSLGLPLTSGEGDDYYHSEQVDGTKHFGVWPLRDAAQACFGTDDWPSDLVVPQASIEFEVESPEAVTSAAEELEAKGHSLVHGARVEPWGQTVARLLSPEHLIIGISFAPWFHDTEGG